MLYIVRNPFVADGIKVSVNVKENIKFNGFNTAPLRIVLSYIFLFLFLSFALILKKNNNNKNSGLSGCIISLFLLASLRGIAVLNSSGWQQRTVDKLEVYWILASHLLRLSALILVYLISPEL